MHRSRLCAIAIDVPAEAYAATVHFWAGALDPTKAAPAVDQVVVDPEDPYTQVGSVAGREVFVQAVDDAPRVHLDIETDDVEAEVARLEALGATRVQQVRTWWVCRDPSGQLFCVVRPQTADFPGDASAWP